MLKECFKDLTKNASFKYPVTNTLKWIVTEPSMRKRVMVSIGAIIIYRLLFFIPLPGINGASLEEFFNNIARTQPGGPQNTISLLSSGAFRRLSICALGLMPFVSSCLLLQFGSLFIPILKKYLFGGESGRQKITKLTYIFTMILSAVQAYFTALWLENPAHFGGMQIVTDPGFGFRLLVIVTLAAVVALLLFIAEMVNRHGIGNGVAILFFSGFLLSFFTATKMTMGLQKAGGISSRFPLLLAAIFIVLTYAVFYITSRTKAVELKNSDQKKIRLHLRPSILGHEPIAWAALIYLPLSFLTGKLNFVILENYFIRESLYVVFIFIFTYLYALLVFDSNYMVNLANKYGYSLIADNGNSSEDYLNDRMSKVLILSAMILSVFHIIPGLIHHYYQITPDAVLDLFKASTLLVMVGIFFDIISQAEFFRKKSDSGNTGWAVCYTAFDEFEAKIKSEYLQDKGIQALVEPLRYTWGMPVRTMVDQYRIYVSTDKKEAARSLLVN